MATVTICSGFGAQEEEISRYFHFSPSICCAVMEPNGEGNGNPLQCSCLENPRDGEPGRLPSMGSHRDRHDWSNLAAAATKAEDIKKRWQQYTGELYKKDLHDPHYHNGVIACLKPDILECKVKWVLGNITTTKLVEVIEFQLSCFKSQKMMLWKCCTQYTSKFGKLSSGHRTGKCLFSFQS